LDFQIGRVLDELERLGIAENTLVMYTADHGDMCGSHGMIDKHCIMYDDVVRVPLMMCWPGHIKPGTENHDFVVNAIDAPATWCAAAGTAIPDYCSGIDLLQALENGTGREDVFATYHGNQFGNYSQRMVRDRRWKYVWNVSDLDELYDLENDSGELHNLIGDASHASELQRLRQRLVHWLEATHDTLNNHSLKTQLLEGRICDAFP
jgi:arylsulfatase A-like enzyme